MDYSYVQALITRAKWKKWMEDTPPAFLPEFTNGVENLYYHSLSKGDTYFMNRHFCDLVEKARATVPDDLAFDMSWMNSVSGWMALETPATLPIISGLKSKVQDLKMRGFAFPKITAVGWICLKDLASSSEEVVHTSAAGEEYRRGSATVATSVSETEVVEFMIFTSSEAGRFSPWAYFSIRSGETVLARLREYEKRIENHDAAYDSPLEADKLHEVRWVFTAFHLMAQRLAMTVTHNTDRATRRRSKREQIPVTPFLKVITLRKLEEDRPKGTKGVVDWQWQWAVTGHWRNQYLNSTGEYKHIWIESYVKGPPEKPMKPIPMKVFIAGR